MPPVADPNADPAELEDPVIEVADPATDPPADPAADPKDRNRAGYEARQAKKEADDLRKELEGYKRRDEDARKAKLTEEQKVQEERDALRQENAQLKTERLQQKVAAEFKLPAALAARLIGSDEESLRADAAELAKLLPKPKAGTTTDPSREGGGAAKTFKRSELRDPAFYKANEAAILQAQREGRITND